MRSRLRGMPIALWARNSRIPLRAAVHRWERGETPYAVGATYRNGERMSIRTWARLNGISRETAQRLYRHGAVPASVVPWHRDENSRFRSPRRWTGFQIRRLLAGIRRDGRNLARLKRNLGRLERQFRRDRAELSRRIGLIRRGLRQRYKHIRVIERAWAAGIRPMSQARAEQIARKVLGRPRGVSGVRSPDQSPPEQASPNVCPSGVSGIP